MSSIFKYLSKLFNKKNTFAHTKIDKTMPVAPYDISVSDTKSERVYLLLQIRHIKNIYYKYTNNALFRQDMYDTFLTDTDFDYGNVAFDDEEDNIRIFDKYILQYIELRKEFLQGLQKYELYESVGKLEERTVDDNHHILFIMDMTDKRVFEYCFSNMKVNVVDALFSAIIYQNMNMNIKVFR